MGLSQQRMIQSLADSKQGSSDLHVNIANPCFFKLEHFGLEIEHELVVLGMMGIGQDVRDGLPEGKGNVWGTMEEELLRPEGEESIELLFVFVGFWFCKMEDGSLRIEKANERQKVLGFVDDGGSRQEEIVGGSSQQREDDAMVLGLGIAQGMSFVDDDGGPELKEEGGDSAFDGSLLVHGRVGAVDEVESLVFFVPKVKGVAEGFVRVDGGEENTMLVVVNSPSVKVVVPGEDLGERISSVDDEDEIRVDVCATNEFLFELLQDGFWDEEEGGKVILCELFKDAEQRGERFARAHTSTNDAAKGSGFEFVQDGLLLLSELDVELPVEGNFWGRLGNVLLFKREIDVLLSSSMILLLLLGLLLLKRRRR